jgi:hypothetical protein
MAVEPAGKYTDTLPDGPSVIFAGLNARFVVAC